MYLFQHQLKFILGLDNEENSLSDIKTKLYQLIKNTPCYIGNSIFMENVLPAMLKRIKSSICGNVKLSRPLRFQYVKIAKAFMNTFTVLAMVHYDSPRFELYGKILRRKSSTTMSIDNDLTNTANFG